MCDINFSLQKIGLCHHEPKENVSEYYIASLKVDYKIDPNYKRVEVLHPPFRV